MRVTTYKEFEVDVLPKIKELGYNCIQMSVRALILSLNPNIDFTQDGHYGARILRLQVLFVPCML